MRDAKHVFNAQAFDSACAALVTRASNDEEAAQIRARCDEDFRALEQQISAEATLKHEELGRRIKERLERINRRAALEEEMVRVRKQLVKYSRRNHCGVLD